MALINIANPTENSLVSLTARLNLALFFAPNAEPATASAVCAKPVSYTHLTLPTKA